MVSTSTLKSAPLSPKPAHHSLVPHWLTHLGIPGLFLIAVIDSTVFPLPLPGSSDLLLLWLVSHHGNPWLLAASAISGSLLGGYTSWSTGRKGGEAALHHYVDARRVKRISGWVERHAILSVFLPGVLPPPIPLSPFLVAAGALKVSRQRFLAVFGAARSVRFGVIAWLGVAYGRGMVRLWSATLDKWSAPLLWVFFGLVLGGICLGIWEFRKQRKSAGSRRAPLAATTRIEDV